MPFSIKKCFSLAALIFTLSANLKAQDSLVVIFQQYEFMPGDSIKMEAWVDNHVKGSEAKTLNLWIDNVETGERWKFRYPFINGYLRMSLKINKDLPPGNYAFNFLLQKDFFNINGTILKGPSRLDELNYMITAKYKIPVINAVSLQPDRSFSIRDLYFKDSAVFAFSPPVKGKKEKNNLELRIRTSLDSVFVPTAIVTEMIPVGKKAVSDSLSLEKKAAYSFSTEGIQKAKLLKEVTVKAKTKSEIQEYNDRFVNPVLNEGDAKTINLLNSEEHLSFPDLISYVTFKFPNLTQRTNPDNGQSFLMQRNEVVDIYIDEFLDTDFHASSVSLTDVAMIKYFVQGLRIGGGINDNGMGGSIVIYTRRVRESRSNKLSNYAYLLKGYSGLATEWK